MRSNTVTRGSSGAMIERVDSLVLKSHDNINRIVAQGNWLMKYTSPCLPTVYSVDAVGDHAQYIMESLVRPPAWALDHKVVLHAMFDGLHEHVWSRQAVVPFNLQELYVKMGYISTEFNLTLTRTKLFQLSDTIRWDDPSIVTCLTHGDPTFDNVMFREDTGELVLIDPIPATRAIPDLRCVDIGKILQSVVGFERVRYSTTREKFMVTPTEVQQMVLSYNEWQASVFWCVVHLFRAFPYVPTTVQSGLRICIEEALSLF